MDSKSISRKGVGVQVPASAPTRATDDAFGAALLPVLLHRVNNTTQLLSGLNSLLALGQGQRVLRERADDLAWASTSMHECGWLMAVLASARGADLVLARREPDGLAQIVRLTGEALRRESRDLEQADRTLPAVSADVGSGWELEWSIAGWLWSCARTLPPRSALAWELGRSSAGHELRAGGRFDDALRERMRSIRELLPELDFREETGTDAPTMLIPVAWLREAARRM